MSTAAAALTDHFEIAGHPFHSRLIIGTGKYRTFAEMKAAHDASGAEMVTVAVRRVPLIAAANRFSIIWIRFANSAKHRRLLFGGRSRAHRTARA